MTNQEILEKEREEFVEKFMDGRSTENKNNSLNIYHQEICQVTSEMMDDLLRFKTANPTKTDAFDKSLKRLLKLSEISNTYTYLFLMLFDLIKQQKDIELKSIKRLELIIEKDSEIEKLKNVIESL